MTLFVQGGSPVWCIGLQKIQGQGITILGGNILPNTNLHYAVFYPRLKNIGPSLSADLVLKDKIVVYDLAGQRIGWANYDCKFHNPYGISSYTFARSLVSNFYLYLSGSSSVNVSTTTSTGQSEYFNTRQMSNVDVIHKLATSSVPMCLIHTLLLFLVSFWVFF